MSEAAISQSTDYWLLLLLFSYFLLKYLSLTWGQPLWMSTVQGPDLVILPTLLLLPSCSEG